jgi:hypothetical protein
MLYREGGEDRFILNVGKLVSNYIASQAARLLSQHLEPRISYQYRRNLLHTSALSICKPSNFLRDLT